MARSALTPEEKEALGDVEEFNRTHGQANWRLKDRIVAEMSLDGIRIADARVENVQFDHVRMSRSTIGSTVFEGTDFDLVDLENAVIEGCRFSRCTFSGGGAKGARFADCEFSACKVRRFNMENVVLEACKFEDFEGDALPFTGAQLTGTTFSQSKLEDCTFYNTKINDVRFDSSAVNKAIFSGMNVEALTFTGGEVTESSFDDGHLYDVTFEDNAVSRLTLAALEGSNLFWKSCEVVDLLAFIECKCRQVTLTDCKTIHELTSDESSLTDLVITGGVMKRPDLSNSTIAGQSEIRGVTIESGDFSLSGINGLQIEDTVVQKRLVLDGTAFVGLRLQKVELAPGCEVRSQNVTYEDSDRFE